MSNEKFGYPPPGGDTGQVLTKRSAESGDYDWATSSGVVIGGYDENYLGFTTETVTCDGSTHINALNPNAPRDWYDPIAQAIILPGLYISCPGIHIATPFTASAGLIAVMLSVFNFAQGVLIEELEAGAPFTIGFNDVQALNGFDLPWSIGGNMRLKTPIDATGELALTYFLARAVH